MSIDKEKFLHPPAKYRMNPMIHVWPAADRGLFMKALKDYGFGGVVTNVYQENGFTSNPANLRQFASLVNELNENDLSYWIYDESGYPSGSGGGLVLRDHPELEAKGLYMHRIITYTSRKAEYRLDCESDRIVWAARYQVDVSVPQESVVQYDTMQPVTFSDDTVCCELQANEILYIFCQKPAYEGSHCTHNICSYNRYINILNPDAVRRFLELCYEPVESAAPGAYAHARGVFTDEPALQTFYVCPYEQWSYALLPWEERLPEIFEKMYGEKLYPLLPMLFEGAETCWPARVRFYEMIGHVIGESYSGQIQKWCHAHGSRFSGHYFGEEMIVDHVRSYGNMLSVQRRTDYPGMDILACWPEGYFPQDAKYVQMAARKCGSNGFMAEVCPFDNPKEFAKAPFDNLLATMGLNYISGVRTTQSYAEADFSEFANGRFRDFVPRNQDMFGEARKYFNREQMRLLNAYVGRMGLLLDGLSNLCTTVVYFGIEDVQAKYTPKHDSEVGAGAISCDQATLRLLHAMLERGRDFLLADSEDMFEIAKTGKLGGETVRRVLLPGIDAIRPETLEALRQLKAADVSVLFTEKLPHIDALSGKQLDLSGEFRFVSAQEASDIPSWQEPQFQTLSGPCVRQARYRTADGKTMFFLLNAGRTDSIVRLPGADAHRCAVFDPFTGAITEGRLNEKRTVPAVRGIFIINEESKL